MKKISCIFLFVTFAIVLFADPACLDSMQVTQPDGTKLWTIVHGDEFYNWRSTTDGNVLLCDEEQHYCYAKVEGDSLISTKFVAHNISERTIAETAFIKENRKIVNDFIFAERNVVMNREQVRKAAERDNAQEVATQATNAVVGQRKILTILVGFSDRPFTKTVADFDKLMNQKTGKVESNYGSVWRFYNEDSYGKLDVSAVVIGPFVAKHNSLYYRWDKTNSSAHVKELIQEAVDFAKKSGINFSQFDGDNDGYVDCIHVVFAGHGLSGGAADGLIWAHQSAIKKQKINSKYVSEYIITPELSNNNTIAPIGTICHEFGHILGVPDFYDVANSQYFGTGDYDLMGGGGWNGNGYRPCHHNAYSKCYILGWGQAKILPKSTKTYTLPPSTLEPAFYRINTGTEECFIVENRIYASNYFDAYIPNEGLLIYHIHKDLATTIAKDDYINSQHPLQCYIVNASATQNPTAVPESYGERRIQRAFPGVYKDKTTFTTRSTPSFTAWNGSGTGIDICFIKQNPDKSISFTVNPQIEGPDHLCGERTYSVTGIVPDKDTIVWSYASNIEFIRAFPVLKFPNGRQGASVSVVRGAQFVRLVDSIGDRLPDSPIIMSMAETQSSGQSVWAPYTGTVTLAATVHSGNGTYRIEKEIELPKNKAPELDIPFVQKPMWFANQTRTFTEKGNPNIEGAYIKWYVKYPQDMVFTEYTGRSVSLTPTKAGTITIRVVNDCGCPTRNETTYTFDILSTVRPPSIRFSYPNPVGTSTLPIVVEQDHSGESDIAVQSIADNLPEYTIELWSDILGRVRTITSNDPYVELDITGLPAGWYQLLLLQDGQLIDSGKVLIGQ